LLNKSLKLLAIVGPESTGKSTLCKQLAEATGYPYVPEIARTYLETHGLKYTADDVEQIGRLQLKAENAAMSANPQAPLLICDTNLLVIQIWMEHAFGYCPDWIVESLKNYHYTHTILTDIDMPWQHDEQREHPHLRTYFLGKYKQLIEHYGIEYTLVSGIEKERLAEALTIAKRLTQ